MITVKNLQILPGTGRWQPQANGGVGLIWGESFDGWRALIETPPSLRATSPFRGGFNCLTPSTLATITGLSYRIYS